MLYSLLSVQSERAGPHEALVETLHSPMTTALAENSPGIVQSRRLNHELFFKKPTITSYESDFGSGEFGCQFDGALRAVQPDVHYDVVEVWQFLLEFPPEDAALFRTSRGADGTALQ